MLQLIPHQIVHSLSKVAKCDHQLGRLWSRLEIAGVLNGVDQTMNFAEQHFGFPTKGHVGPRATGAQDPSFNVLTDKHQVGPGTVGHNLVLTEVRFGYFDLPKRITFFLREIKPLFVRHQSMVIAAG